MRLLGFSRGVFAGPPASGWLAGRGNAPAASVRLPGWELDPSRARQPPEGCLSPQPRVQNVSDFWIFAHLIGWEILSVCSSFAFLLLWGRWAPFHMLWGHLHFWP